MILSDTMDSYLDADLMGSLSLVVPCWTMGTIEGEQERGLLQAVEGGVGLGGWHGGMCDAFRNHCNYQMMTGGQFVGHPDGVKDYTVDIASPGDPVVRGMDDFRMHSEQYLHARRPRQRGAGHDDLRRPQRSLGQRHGDARGLEADLGRREGVLLLPGPRGRRLRGAGGPGDPATAACCGPPGWRRKHEFTTREKPRSAAGRGPRDRRPVDRRTVDRRR